MSHDDAILDGSGHSPPVTLNPEYLEFVTAGRAWVAADKDAEDAATAVMRADGKLREAGRAARLADADGRERANAAVLERQRQYDNANAWHAIQCAAEQRADERMRLAASRLVALHPEPEKP